MAKLGRVAVDGKGVATTGLGTGLVLGVLVAPGEGVRLDFADFSSSSSSRAKSMESTEGKSA